MGQVRWTNAAAASPDVRFTSDSNQTGAAQRSDASCQKPPEADAAKSTPIRSPHQRGRAGARSRFAFIRPLASAMAGATSKDDWPMPHSRSMSSRIVAITNFP